MRRLFLALIGLGGCETITTCETVDSRAVEWDEMTPLGFSAADALAEFSGPFDFVDAVASGRPEDSGLGLTTEQRTGSVLFTELRSVRSRRLRRFRTEALLVAPAPCVSSISAPVQVNFAFAADRPIEMAGDMTVTDPVTDGGMLPDGVTAILRHSVPAWLDALPDDVDVNSVETQVNITDDAVRASVAAFPPAGRVVLLDVNEER
ncbi:MAG: hypothetical protein AB8H79_04900 [Myxococcota bacterium]